MSKLYEHQRVGVDLFKKHQFFANFGEMGCGKTATAIVAIAELGLNNAIVVCPKPLIDNWVREISEWAPGYTALPCDGKTKVRREILNRLFDVNLQRKIFIINYEALLSKFVNQIFKVKWQVKVFDESHKLKGVGKKVKIQPAAKRIQSYRTWIMTGTPQPNNPLEIFGQFDVGLPGYLGSSYYHFRNRYADIYAGNGYPQIRRYINQDELKVKIARY